MLKCNYRLPRLNYCKVWVNSCQLFLSQKGIFFREFFSVNSTLWTRFSCDITLIYRSTFLISINFFSTISCTLSFRFYALHRKGQRHFRYTRWILNKILQDNVHNTSNFTNWKSLVYFGVIWQDFRLVRRACLAGAIKKIASHVISVLSSTVVISEVNRKIFS